MQEQRLLTNPFIDKYPLHVTLYLTNYNAKHIPSIKKRVAQFAKTQSPVDFTTSRFVVNPSNYVMLAVDSNANLQKMSQQIVNLLSDLRDKNASIPAWAANDPQRVTLFAQYGSPSVSQLFNPHFSVMDAQQPNEIVFSKLQLLLGHINAKVTATGIAIGIGIANEQGQIIQELGSYNLPVLH